MNIKEYRCSKETRHRMSLAQMGHSISEETRQKIGLSNKGQLKGRTLSDEHKMKISKALTGHQVLIDTRNKISAAHTGRNHSPETRQKISNSRKGIGHQMSDEACKKISLANKGKVRSPEIRAAMCEQLRKNRANGCGFKKGHIPTLETRQKISESGKGKHINQIISLEERRKRSETQVNRILQGRSLPPCWPSVKKGQFYSTKNKTYIRYESSSEYRLLTFLESIDRVISFNRCQFNILYVQPDSTIHRYIPDFLVYTNQGGPIIIEVKPKSMLKQFVDIGKFTSLIQFCEVHGFRYVIFLGGTRRRNEDCLVTIRETGDEIYQGLEYLVA